jgi:hypothetical protein
VIDPRTGILQVRGADCFAMTALVRRPLASTGLDRAGSAGGRAGLLRAGADLSMKVQLDAAEEHSLPALALRPLPACAAALRDLAEAGAPIDQLQVVQSVLVADLEVERCAAARAGGGALAGSGAVDARRCATVQGSRAVVAHRWAPLQLDLPGPPAAARKARTRGPPCWLSAPCPPHPAPRFAQAVGRGNTVGDADAAARAAVLGPHALRLVAARGGAPPEALAALAAAEARLRGAVQIAARAQDGAQAASLAVLDRPALAGALRAEATALDATLAALLPAAAGDASPLVQLGALRAAAPAAAELFAVQVLLAGVDGAAAPPGPTPAALAAQRAAARAALRVAVAPGPATERLRAAVGAQGLSLVDDDAPDAHLRIRLSARPGPGAPHPTGLVTRVVHLELQAVADGRPLPSVGWTEQWAGADAAAAEAAAWSAAALRAEAELGRLLETLL